MLTEQSTKPTPTGAGCLPVCVSKEGQLLVLVHTTTRGKKMGQLIDFGGGIYEDDVSLQDCAARELAEETSGFDFFHPTPLASASSSGKSENTFSPEPTTIIGRVHRMTSLIASHLKHHEESLSAANSHGYTVFILRIPHIDISVLEDWNTQHGDGKRIFQWVGVDRIVSGEGVHPRLAFDSLQSLLGGLSVEMLGVGSEKSKKKERNGAGEHKKPKFAVINCEDNPMWADLPFVWRRYLEEDSEEWHTYKAWEALPQRPEDYRGLVLTGSHHCSFDVDVPWITALKAYVADCVANQRTRLLGGCFGCQLIARACGGEVTRNLGGSFIFRPERIEVDLKAVQSLPYYEYGLEKEPMFLQGARDAQTITAMEVHGDSVISLPPGAIRLGHSPTSPNELYAIGHTALASQSHPEFSVGLMLKDLAPLVIKRGSVPPTELGSSLEAIAGPLGRGPQQLLQLYRAFLKAPSKE